MEKVEFIKAKSEIIVEDVDRRAFEEVANCYLHGFFKAGYILCWTVLAESLRGKIKQLADLGYAPAIAEFQKIEKLEQEHCSADRQIAESAKECELITDNELSIVMQLWERRCLFAHPYGNKVTQTDFEDIIEKTVDYSMARPLYYTKKMIDEKLDEYVNHPHIIPSPDKFAERIDQFLKLVLAKHEQTLFNALFYRMRIRIDNEQYGDTFRFLLKFCWELFIKRGLDINDKRFRIDTGISTYPEATMALVAKKELWAALTDDRKEQLVKWVKSVKLSHFMIDCIRFMMRNGCTDIDGLFAYYYENIKNFPLKRAYNLFVDKDLLISHIYDKYIKGFQFANQGDFIDFISGYTKLKDELTPDQCRRIGEFVATCCYTGTWKAQDFFASASSDWFSSKDFLIGVFEGFAMSTDKQYPDFSHMTNSLRALKLLDKHDSAAAQAEVDKWCALTPRPNDFFKQYKIDELTETVEGILPLDKYPAYHSKITDYIKNKA